MRALQTSVNALRAMAPMDLRTCSVFDLYARGLLVVAEYDASQAVRHYCWLHLDANEAEVREELNREIARLHQSA